MVWKKIGVEILPFRRLSSSLFTLQMPFRTSANKNKSALIKNGRVIG